MQAQVATQARRMRLETPATLREGSIPAAVDVNEKKPSIGRLFRILGGGGGNRTRDLPRIYAGCSPITAKRLSLFFDRL